MEIIFAAIICSLIALVSKKLSFPTIPLYILAGLVLGEWSILTQSEISEFLSKIGVILLLFYIGLHINPEEIRKKKGMIFSAGMFDLIVNFPLIFFVSLALGFSYSQAFILASALYVSSSAIVLQSLIENRKLIYKEAETIVWIMVFEDIVIALLIVLNSLNFTSITVFFVKLSVFTLLAMYLSKRVKGIEGIFTRDDEVPILFSFSIALLSIAFEELFDIPLAYASIMLGLIFSGIKRVREIIVPFKEVFLAIFFFFFGLSAEITLKGLESFLMILVTIVGKILSGILTGFKIHRSFNSGMEIGMSTIARGEFSAFLVYAYGDPSVISIVMLVIIFTSILGTILSKYSERIIQSFQYISRML